MILTECATFSAMLVGGVLASVAGRILFALGRASRVAEAIFDFLAPIAAGAIFFFSLRLSADGAFRVYCLAAFALGVGAERLLYGRLSPVLRRIARRIVTPLKSLAESLERRAISLFSPLCEKCRTLVAKRREKREKKRIEREGKRAVALEEKRVRKELRIEAKRRKKRARIRMRKRRRDLKREARTSAPLV